MRILFFIFSLFSAIALNAHEKYVFEDRIAFTFAPLSAVDYNPRLRVGFEVNLTQKEALNIDFGFSTTFLEHGIQSSSVNKYYHFFEIRPQFKKVVFKGYDLRIYLGMEVFASFARRQFFDHYYYPENFDSAIHYKDAKASRQKHGIHLLGGWQFLLANLFLFDMYAGIGLAMRKINYTKINGAYTTQYEEFEEWIPNPYLYENERFIPNIALGMKIGIIQKI